jgi:hypothetical protein
MITFLYSIQAPENILYQAREVFPKTKIATKSSVFDMNGFEEGPKEIKV